MGRSKNTPAPAGHNGAPLTDDELAALQHFHTQNIRRDRKEAAVKKAEYDAVNSKISGHYKMVSKDLGITRKDFEDMLAKEDLSEDEFIAQEEARHARFARQGLPVGAQMDMFSRDTATDQARAYSEGVRAGKRADDPKPPSTVAPILHPEWMRGWAAGQDENAALFLKGNEIADARAKAKEAKAPTLKAEPDEEGDEDEEDGVDKDLKALEAKGWTQPTAEEQAFA